MTFLSGSISSKPDRFYCGNLEELVKEWQEHGGESSLWDYLGISKSFFEKWWKQIKTGKIDA